MIVEDRESVTRNVLRWGRLIDQFSMDEFCSIDNDDCDEVEPPNYGHGVTSITSLVGNRAAAESATLA